MGAGRQARLRQIEMIRGMWISLDGDPGHGRYQFSYSGENNIVDAQASVAVRLANSNQQAGETFMKALNLRTGRAGRWRCASGVLIVLALAACATPQQRVVDKESSLAAAGFVIRPANTPQRQAMLKSLPPNQIVQQPRGDTVNFVYADPLVCNCLYIGNQEAYNAYRRYVQQKQLADEQMAAAEMWSSSAWDWDPWGPSPWGP
jgi:hypothetical protein